MLCAVRFHRLFRLLFQHIIVRMVDAANGIEWNRYFITPPDAEGYLNLKVLKLNRKITN